MRWYGTITDSWPAIDYVDEIYRAAPAVAGRSPRAWPPPSWSGWAAGWRPRIVPLALLVQAVVPRLVVVALRETQRDFARAALHRPHIHATRSAYGLEKRIKEVDFQARPEARIDVGRTRTCSTTSGCGIGAPFTTPSRRSRLCVPTTPSSRDRMSTAIPSTASTGRCCSLPANWISASCSDARTQLDQSAFHLHARLWPGHGRSQQDHPRRPAGAADRERAAGNQDPQPQAHPPGNLLRRE